MRWTPLALALVATASCRDGTSGDPHAGHAKPPPAVDPHAGHAKPPPAVDPHAGHAGQGGHGAHAAVPDGHAEIAIADDRQQRIGLRLGTAERLAVEGSVRASAIIQADEQRQAHVHSRLMGYVRELYVNKVGQTVKRGQPLYTIYSQDLLVAQQEYLRARTFSPDLAAAARERLRLWDIPDDQVARIESSGKPLETVSVRSPIAGTVIEKSIVAGHFVEPDMMLYLIADLSRLWVLADVYEYELGRIDRKGTATVHVEGLDTPVTAPIDYIYPTVDTASRTVKIRLVLDNPRGDLRPGNFATVDLPVSAAPMLSVPEEAVIDTGLRQVVYVAIGDDRFRPVEVEIGRRLDGRAEIRRGLADGDRVVVSAQFLVDSESRLRAGGSGPGHGGH